MLIPFIPFILTTTTTTTTTVTTGKVKVAGSSGGGGDVETMDTSNGDDHKHTPGPIAAGE